MKEKYKVGIIGLGAIAPYYLKALNENVNCNLHYVCDIDKNKLDSFSKSGISITTEMDILLQSNTVDIVIINLPNDLHYKACQRALLCGKHVCCEKPLTISSAEAEILSKTAQDNNAVLFTAFHRRYNSNLLANFTPGTKQIKKIVIRYFEKIEDHCFNNAWYLDPRKCGGGVIADNGPNAMDLLRYFFKDIVIDSVIFDCCEKNTDYKALINAHSDENNIAASIELDWQYPNGECKDIIIQYADGSDCYIDLLVNYGEFKSSLYHEYVGVLEDFFTKIEHRDFIDSNGIESVKLIEDIYQKSLRINGLKFNEQIYN